MGKVKTLHSFFKRKDVEDEIVNNNQVKRQKAQSSECESEKQDNQQEPAVSEAPPSNANELDLNNLERDPGKRKQMFDYPSTRYTIFLSYLHMYFRSLFC